MPVTPTRTFAELASCRANAYVIQGGAIPMADIGQPDAVVGRMNEEDRQPLDASARSPKPQPIGHGADTAARSEPSSISIPPARPGRADTVRAISMPASAAPSCGSQAQIWRLCLSSTPGQEPRNRVEVPLDGCPRDVAEMCSQIHRRGLAGVGGPRCCAYCVRASTRTMLGCHGWSLSPSVAFAQRIPGVLTTKRGKTAIRQSSSPAASGHIGFEGPSHSTLHGHITSCSPVSSVPSPAWHAGCHMDAPAASVCSLTAATS
ncbi:uncharacterized protein B0H18DRAFT_566002 [Fomitopsis serialis]|uniref:uncharacterized protein n=1 Tax=Fomitopsis serialis TaxID=139415 RepID=UPI002008B3DF|nr:uncharacterized protein B0H18DRAFT_566002 [Neoantrodia serialis]KAH9921317.1 hypothetical protein B0H18DRAFT_566002 [Neoantrodia serialis]